MVAAQESLRLSPRVLVNYFQKELEYDPNVL
jgi:hypothetical protein